MATSAVHYLGKYAIAPCGKSYLNTVTLRKGSGAMDLPRGGRKPPVVRATYEAKLVTCRGCLRQMARDLLARVEELNARVDKEAIERVIATSSIA